METTPSSEQQQQPIKLPIGFRFHPTDQELLLHYLKRKLYSLPLPPSLIPDHFDVFHSNPWDLPGDLKEKRYFFCKTKMNFMTKCSLISSDCGYWKSSAKDKQVMAPPTATNPNTHWIKKSFLFYHGKTSPLLKTQWVMHQFCLVASFTPPYLLPQKLMMQVGDWVVCRVYQRKRKARNQVANYIKKPRTLQGIRTKDHMNLRMGDKNELGFSSAQTCLSSISCCSGITEISCNELDEEASSQNTY
ncbi:UNVERIFIED_CONTAM: NAC domain-containing protein 83 [Sesamum radiatum]|uniref:NAC domain-containing protein 83 n=1 Tax=Sesamum radiatum TaxID=300843 RepID=A0AAW2P6T9_SESRA